MESLVFTSTTPSVPRAADERQSQRGLRKTSEGIELGGPADSHLGDPKAQAVTIAETSVLEARCVKPARQ